MIRSKRVVRAFWGRNLLLAMLLAAELASAPARADTAVAALDLKGRQLLERLVAERASVIAAERKLANDKEEKLLRDLAESDHRLSSSLKASSATEAKLAKVAAQRKALIAQLEARDRDFAEQVSAFREAITGVLSTANPRKRAALERYASGDRAEGYRLFDEITKAEIAQKTLAFNLAVAADLRAQAQLAYDRAARGEMSGQDVIALIEQVVKLDASFPTDWINLTTYYLAAQWHGKALLAAQNAEKAAIASAKQKPDSVDAARDLAIAHGKLGNIALVTDDLKEAWRQYGICEELSKELLRKHPDSFDAKRDIAVAYDHMGTLRAIESERARPGARLSKASEALKYYEKSRSLSQEAFDQTGSIGDARDVAASYSQMARVALSNDNPEYASKSAAAAFVLLAPAIKTAPGWVELERRMAMVLTQLGNVERLSQNLDKAAQQYEDASRYMARLVRDQASALVVVYWLDEERALASAYEELGEAAARANDRAGATIWYSKGLKLAELTSKFDPNSARAKQKIWRANMELGDASTQRSDAQKRFSVGLKIIEKMRKDGPDSAELIRMEAVTRLKLARVTHSSELGNEAVRMVNRLKSEGTLSAQEQQMFDALISMWQSGS